MYPVLFKIGSLAVNSYGFCIALGALAGYAYMARQTLLQFALSFDQSNTLFLILVLGGMGGGKLFTVFENPSWYLSEPSRLFSGSGFVFYGAFLVCIPLMLWFFKMKKLPVWPMLDIMAVTTCILHMIGRVGCFLAGCCYGKPTDGIFGVTFTSPISQADPLNTPLHPTQLYEATVILVLLLILLFLKSRQQFEGQLFLIYLVGYASGRIVLEYFRGDISRGFLFQNQVSNSQLIALLVLLVAGIFYVRRRKANLVVNPVKPWNSNNPNNHNRSHSDRK